MNICAPHTSHLLTTLPNRLYLDFDFETMEKLELETKTEDSHNLKLFPHC